MAEHTPGPLFVREDKRFPFDITIVDADGHVVAREDRYATSSRQETLEDCRLAVGFPSHQHKEVMAALARQMADIHLRAAAPDMLAALKDCAQILTTLAVIQDDAGVKKEIREHRDQARAAIAKAEDRAEGRNQ